MEKKGIIKHLTIRANFLAACGEWTDKIEDSYWKIKKELMEWERLWELEKPRFYWSEQMKDDLAKLSLALDDVWRLQAIR